MENLGKVVLLAGASLLLRGGVLWLLVFLLSHTIVARIAFAPLSILSDSMLISSKRGAALG